MLVEVASLRSRVLADSRLGGEPRLTSVDRAAPARVLCVPPRPLFALGDFILETMWLEVLSTRAQPHRIAAALCALATIPDQIHVLRLSMPCAACESGSERETREARNGSDVPTVQPYAAVVICRAPHDLACTYVTRGAVYVCQI